MKIIDSFKKWRSWTSLAHADVDSNLYVTGDHDKQFITVNQEKLLQRHLAEVEDVPFYFFTVPLANFVDVWDTLKHTRLGCHGLIHIHHAKLDFSRQYTLIKIAKKRLCNPSYFRAPYLSINRDTIRAVALNNFLFDFSFSFGRMAKHFKHLTQPRRLDNTTFVPGTMPSDTYLRHHNITNQNVIFRFWKRHAEKILEKDGVVVVHIHPTVFDTSQALGRFLKWIGENGLKN